MFKDPSPSGCERGAQSWAVEDIIGAKAGHGPHPRRRSFLERWLPTRAARRERRLEERLAEAAWPPSSSEAHHTRLIEAIPDGICVTRGGRVEYVNRSLAKLVGLAVMTLPHPAAWQR